MVRVTSSNAEAAAELTPVLAQAIGHVLWRARARVAESLAETLPPGVDIHAYAALLALPVGTTRSQQAVADAISVSRTTMAKLAKDLADRGLVTRERNSEDRRSYSLTRTAEGAATARRWRRHAEDVEEHLTAGFSVSEREELRALLRAATVDDLPLEAPDALRDSIGFLTTVSHSGVHRVLSEQLTPWQINPSHMGTLMFLDRAGPLPQAEIARAIGTSAAHVVALIDDLERAGLVVRRRNSEDRRVQTVHLAPGTEATVGEITEVARTVARERLDAVIGTDRTDRLCQLLARLVTSH